MFSLQQIEEYSGVGGFLENLTVDWLSTIVLRPRPCNKFRAMTALVHSEASPTRGIIQSPALTRSTLT